MCPEDIWQCLETFDFHEQEDATGLYIQQCTGQSPKQRIILPKMSIALMWRDSHLSRYIYKLKSLLVCFYHEWVLKFSQMHSLYSDNHVFLFVGLFVFEMEFRSCCLGWSAMVRCQLTITSASWVHEILLPQSPE